MIKKSIGKVHCNLPDKKNFISIYQISDREMPISFIFWIRRRELQEKYK
jgi:hypothetical protein